MSETVGPNAEQSPSTEQPAWKRWLDPATLPGAVLAAVLGGLIVLAITAVLALL